MEICKDLEFLDAGHKYYLNGSEIPSVSSIIKPLARKVYERVSRDSLDNAAQRGTEVHSCIEYWLKFKIVDIRSEFKPYFNAFMEWWDINNPEVIGTEIRFYHKAMLFAGTSDLICNIDGVTTLVDYKTSSSINETYFRTQLEAYVRALESQGVKIQSKKILHLKKDGKWKVHDYPVVDTDRWRKFQALYQLQGEI